MEISKTFHRDCAGRRDFHLSRPIHAGERILGNVCVCVCATLIDLAAISDHSETQPYKGGLLWTKMCVEAHASSSFGADLRRQWHRALLMA